MRTGIDLLKRNDLLLVQMENWFLRIPVWNCVIDHLRLTLGVEYNKGYAGLWGLGLLRMPTKYLVLYSTTL